MIEKLETYDLKGIRLGAVDRDQFYREVREEFKKTGKVTRQLKTIRLQLMSPEGRLFVQKRSKIKKENPGLYDKTIGGHVGLHDSFNLTVVKECAEELGIPAAVFTASEFNRAIQFVNLDVIGLFREIDIQNNFQSIRKSVDGDFVQPYICAFYVGYYDGSIRFRDGESSGIETFDLSEIQEDVMDRPEKYTEDLKYILKKYKDYYVPLKNL